MSILISFISLVTLVSINLALSHKGSRLYWLYEASHFIGGFLLAVLLSNFLDKKCVLLAVLAIGSLWELYELVVTRNIYLKEFFKAKLKIHIIPPTISDTALDILLNILGTAFYLYLF